MRREGCSARGWGGRAERADETETEQHAGNSERQTASHEIIPTRPAR
jgi:hypothetical protein